MRKVPLSGYLLICPPHGGLPFSCPPHGGGAGGGFGLLGEQSLQQPPPSLRDTSASGGHIEGKAHFDKLSDHATTGPRVRGGHKRLSLSWMAFLFSRPPQEGLPFLSPSWRGCRGRIRIARGAIPTTTTSGASRHLRQRRTGTLRQAQ